MLRRIPEVVCIWNTQNHFNFTDSNKLGQSFEYITEASNFSPSTCLQNNPSQRIVSNKEFKLFMDLAKAFDAVYFLKLLVKLESLWLLDSSCLESNLIA